MSSSSPELLQFDLDGAVALPRDNGELIFAEPWQSRAFGLLVALADEGLFDYAEVQEAMIKAVGDWEALGLEADEYEYYECWLVALERLVGAHTEVSSGDLELRVEEFKDRPSGHDHSH